MREGQRVQQGGLPRTGWADQRDMLTLSNRQIDLV